MEYLHDNELKALKKYHNTLLVAKRKKQWFLTPDGNGILLKFTSTFGELDAQFKIEHGKKRTYSFYRQKDTNEYVVGYRVVTNKETEYNIAGNIYTWLEFNKLYKHILLK